jgi:hypothetical protein
VVAGVGVEPEEGAVEAEAGGGMADLAAEVGFVEATGGGEGVGEEFGGGEEEEVGEIGERGGRGCAGVQGMEVEAAEGVGAVVGGIDEENFGIGVAFGEGGAEELVAAPDVVPGFEGEEEEVLHRGSIGCFGREKAGFLPLFLMVFAKKVEFLPLFANGRWGFLRCLP